MLTEWHPTSSDTTFSRLGGAEAVQAMGERFYRAVQEREPALAAMYPREPTGEINRALRERFTLFLMGWFGGPQDYFKTHVHPRMRSAHAHLRINSAMRDSWLRCMQHALDGFPALDSGVRSYLEYRFDEMADLLRNAPDE